MRTSIDLGDAQIKALDALSHRVKRSRADLIRQAIDEYLEKRRNYHEGNAFGLWVKGSVDGLAYQEKWRSEW
jgi:metal-responsive CopG/Arc/MetJ family transcriptional regulator